MANYANLLATIAANIYTNNNNEVTAAMVKTAVDQMVASLGAGYQYMGVAIPATNPGTPDYKCFYIASTPGTYTNFGGLVVKIGEVAVLKYDTAWSKEDIGGQMRSIRIAEDMVVAPEIYLGQAYDSSTGILGNFPLLDCTEIIEVPRGCEMVYINPYKYFDICCWDKDMTFIGSIANVRGNNFKNRFVAALLPGTRFFSACFLKSDSFDYTKLVVTTNKLTEMGLASDNGAHPPYFINGKAFGTNGDLQTFSTLDCTPILQIPLATLPARAMLSGIPKGVAVAVFAATFYDKDMVFLAFQSGGNVQIPATAKYVSLCYLNNVQDYDQDTIKIGVTYGRPILPDARDGKKFFLFGDSITYYDSIPWAYDPDYYMVAYPSYIRDILRCPIQNAGVAGDTSNSITTRLLATNLASAYAVTYLGGTNDLVQNVPIGSLGTLDRDTYIGNLEVGLRYVLENYPNVKFYFLSPPYAKNRNITPYCEAMQAVAEAYGIPIIRWDLIGGMNIVNADHFMFDGVHPNNLGHKLFADSLIPFLQNH